ncbi:hypothetical protein [Agromyces humi]|uniref:hypothetical protein n=1 Tax=Agromyces humi TaxID=1766800 RepID=UPI00135B6899|nr:hypothetical protein [Agromyces humi]
MASGLTGSLVVAAVAGTVGENVGYYALVVVRTVRGHARSRRVSRLTGRAARAWATTWLAARSVAAEFGPAELVDSLLVRPVLLWAAAAAWGAHPLAWFAGKLAADAVFYAIAIVSLETGRRVILPDEGRVAGAAVAEAAVAEASTLEASVLEASATGLGSESQPEGALR